MIKQLIVILLGMLLFSCGNPCDDIECGANGTCNEDSESCICDDWYEGTSCEIETRGKFLGTWESTSFCTLGGSTSDPTWTISGGAAPNSIILQSEDVLSNRIIEGTLSDASNVMFDSFTQGSTFSPELRFLNESTLSLTIKVINLDGTEFDCNYAMSK